MDMMDNNIKISEYEKLAMQVMEGFDNPSDEDLASLDKEECVQVCKDLMDVEMVLRQETHTIDVKDALAVFHANRKKVLLRRLVVGVMAAAVCVGFLFLLFGREENVKVKPTLAKVDYIYKVDGNLNAKVSDMPAEVEKKKLCQVVTAHGETKTFRLSDGTEVMLNADSRLTYPETFGIEKRIVQLYGEAFFKVKKDVKHPFVVRSGKVNTTVLGTQFDVKNYGTGAPTIVLVEGKVMLSDSLGQHNVMMSPGQSATLNQQGEFSLKEETDMEGCLSWKDGYLYFDDVSLEQMMNEIGRWYQVDVICRNPLAKKNRVHFYVPNKQSLEKTIEMINKLNVAHVTFDGKQVVVQ